MPRVSASRELLAPVDDVWEFVADPYNLPRWWPRMGGVQPDRRGLAPGARWLVTGENRPSLFRRPEAVGHVLVLEVEPKRRALFQLTGDRLEVELLLEPVSDSRTRATLAIEGRWLIGLTRSLPRQALNRLYGLCQTAATS
jgi:uncharacterized protein YndB with AHSA1/START domain